MDDIEVIQVEESDEDMNETSENEENENSENPGVSTSKGIIITPTRFTPQQQAQLKAMFKVKNSITGTDGGKLAVTFGCKQDKIQNWFRNEKRNTKNKLKAPKVRTTFKKFDYWQTQKLEKFYKNTSTSPTLEQKTELAKSISEDINRVTTWFTNKRKRDSTLVRVELKAPVAPLALASTSTPNTERILISRKGLSYSLRYLRADEDTSGYWYSYATKWSDALSNVVQTAVGISQKINPVDAADDNWRNIQTGIRAINKEAETAGEGDKVGQSKDHKVAKKYCSYRQLVILKDWKCDPSTAVSLEVYAKDKDAAEKIKWWYRLRILAIGTFHPYECLDSFKLMAKELEAVVQTMKPHLSPYNQRWLDFSEEAMKKFLDGGSKKEDLVDEKLVRRFGVKENYGFDPKLISESMKQKILEEQNAA